MWNSIGKTIRRNIPDQTQSVANISNTIQQIPFNQLRTVGYLSRLYLWSPNTAGVFTVGTGTGTAQTGAQFPQLKQIYRFQLNLQAIANLYDVSGVDLGWLQYVRNGFAGSDSIWTLGYSVAGAMPAVNQFPYNWPTNDNSLLGFINQYGPFVQVNTASTTYQAAYQMEIPLSEDLVFPNTPIGKSGNVVILSNTPLEVGMVFMQNNQQNVTPNVQLASAYGSTAESIIAVTGNSTLVISNQQWNIDDEFYDVPPDPNDRPSPLQQSFVVTRQSIDYAVAGQAVIAKYKAAGLLLRAIYSAFNDSAGTGRGTLVDLTQSAATLLYFKSGATITKIQETAVGNAYRSWRRYSATPPGILVHDFVYDHTQGGNGCITQAVDTASLVDVRTEFTGLPASVTRLRVTEVRLIPVTVAQ